VNIKTIAKKTLYYHHLWHLESLSGEFPYRNQTNILILSWSKFFSKNKYPNSILIRKNRKYPAGYPILILSMLTSDKHTHILSTSTKIPTSKSWKLFWILNYKTSRVFRAVVLNLFSTAPPLSNCPSCQAPLKTKNLCKQIYLSVNL